jgi:hypothetical protein
MTILFTHSKQSTKPSHDLLIKTIESLGHIVKSRDLSEDRGSNKFKRDLEIADFMIAEISNPNISLGLEIATAVSKNKHVLVLTSDQKSLDEMSDFIKENSSRYLHVNLYSEKDIEKVLSENIKKIRKQLNYVLYVELSNKYGEIIDTIQRDTNKSKKQIIEESLLTYKPE